jgi:hypothetical protein
MMDDCLPEFSEAARTVGRIFSTDEDEAPRQRQEETAAATRSKPPPVGVLFQHLTAPPSGPTDSSAAALFNAPPPGPAVVTDSSDDDDDKVPQEEEAEMLQTDILKSKTSPHQPLPGTGMTEDNQDNVVPNEKATAKGIFRTGIPLSSTSSSTSSSFLGSATKRPPPLLQPDSPAVGTVTTEEGDDDDDAASSSVEEGNRESSPVRRESTHDSQQQQPQQQQEHYGLLERHARRIARWPKTHFWVAMALTVTIAVVGMVWGDFYVDTNNIGWPSRGTLISNRETQMMLLHTNAWRLATDDAYWEELTTTVQEGWQAGHLTRPTRRLQQQEQHDMRQRTNGRRRALWTTTPSYEYQRKNLTTLMETCNLKTYMDPIFVIQSKLWPVWKVNTQHNSTASALDPDILLDLCLAEEQTQRILEEHQLCHGCQDGTCLPPYSIVLYARFSIEGGKGLTMDCHDLAQAWAPHQAKVEERWLACVKHLRTAQVGVEDYMENLGPCPSMFSPALVDENFEATGRVEYTSSIFVNDWWTIKDSYAYSDGFGRGSDKIQGFYDSQLMQYIEAYAMEIVNRDMVYAVGSVLVTTTAMLVHTRSPFLTFIGILEIMLGFPVAYAIYRFAGQLVYFPYLNLIGVFVMFALGADHVFVMVDKWKNARLDNPTATTEEIAGKALPSAAKAMCLTTTTTAVAFFGSSLCPVVPIKLFGIFCGILIVVDYILDMLFMFPCLCIYDSYRFQQNCLVAWRCCDHAKLSQRPSEEQAEQEHRPALVVDEEEGADAVINCEEQECSKSDGSTSGSNNDDAFDRMGGSHKRKHHNLIQRILHRYYVLLHSFRWYILVLSLAALGLCIYFALTLEVPDRNSEIQILTDGVEYEQARVLRKKLLVEKVMMNGGSTAHVAWGLKPADTGDLNDPYTFSQLVLDDSFDPSSEAAQLHLKGFCPAFLAAEEGFAKPISDDFVCPMDRFDQWLKFQSSLLPEEQSETYRDHCNGATGVPVAEESLHPCLSGYGREFSDSQILSWNGRIRALLIPFTSRVRYTSLTSRLSTEWNLIENWMRLQNDKAPPGVSRPFFSALEWWLWETGEAVYETALNSGAVAIAVSALVILVISRSLSLTLFSAISVVFVLASVTAVLSAADWTLGFL